MWLGHLSCSLTPLSPDMYFTISSPMWVDIVFTIKMYWYIIRGIPLLLFFQLHWNWLLVSTGGSPDILNYSFSYLFRLLCFFMVITEVLEYCTFYLSIYLTVYGCALHTVFDFLECILIALIAIIINIKNYATKTSVCCLLYPALFLFLLVGGCWAAVNL